MNSPSVPPAASRENSSASHSPLPAVLLGGAALEALFLVLLRLSDLKIHVVETIGVAFAAGIVYLVALYAMERAGERRAVLWYVLAAAFLFRVTLLPLQPSLSDDVYRYRWDGEIQHAGWNPYTIAPEDRRLAGFRDRWWEHVSNQQMPNIYPPVTELVLRGTAAFSTHPLVFKMPFFLAEGLLVGLLAFWVRRTGRRSFSLAIYAWNPLVVVEFAGSGHNDPLAMLFSIAALLLIIERRTVLSTLALAVAVLAKFFPILLAPLWLRRTGWPRSGRAWTGLGLSCVLSAAVCWPYRAAWPGVLDLFQPYRQHWVNNASLYTLLGWSSGSDDWAWGIGVGVVAGIAVWATLRNVDPLRAAYLLFGAVPLFSQNAFSWYFLWMAPLLVFFPNPAWLLLTILEFLSYHVLIGYAALGVWKFDPLYLWLEYAPFYALLAARSFLPGKASGAGTD
ncbi:MAG TPA: glycosyltransferase family 87 protein [Candidatus Acidoferrales bacterium]|nr:glycosyltransferase family 87 protein [Candidatus Acidoferrales bacterium]